MVTVVNNPGPGQTQGDGSGLGMILGVIIVLAIVILFFVYGLPRIRGEDKADTNINVELQTPDLGETGQ